MKTRAVNQLSYEWMSLLSPNGTTIPEFVTIMHRPCGAIKHLDTDELHVIICKKCDTRMPSDIENVLRSLVTLEKLVSLNINL